MQNRNRLLVRRWCSGQSIFCSRDSAVRFWDSRKFKPTSATAAMSCAAPSANRSALDSSIQACAQTLLWPRRDVPRRFTWYFFNNAFEPSKRAAALCVLSYDTWPRKTRAGYAALLVLYVQARVDRQLAVVWLR